MIHKIIHQNSTTKKTPHFPLGYYIVFPHNGVPFVFPLYWGLFIKWGIIYMGGNFEVNKQTNPLVKRNASVVERLRSKMGE